MLGNKHRNNHIWSWLPRRFHASNDGHRGNPLLGRLTRVRSHGRHHQFLLHRTWLQILSPIGKTRRRRPVDLHTHHSTRFPDTYVETDWKDRTDDLQSCSFSAPKVNSDTPQKMILWASSSMAGKLYLRWRLAIPVRRSQTLKECRSHLWRTLQDTWHQATWKK